MIPAFSPAIVATSGRGTRRGRAPTGVTTATGASTTLVASHVPPRPTSMTATSTGASANSAKAMPISTSKKLIGYVAAGVDHLHVRRDVVVGLDEPLGASGSPSSAIRSRTTPGAGW